MTSRERVLRTLWRKPVDRAPVSTYELNGYNPDAWENQTPSYRRLMDKIRSDTDCLYMWGWDPWADNTLWDRREETLADGSVKTHSRLRTPKGDLTQTQIRKPDVHTVWTIEHLLKTPEDIARYLSIVPELFRLDEAKVAVARERYAVAEERVGDRGVVMNDGGDPSAYVPALFEFGLFMTMCIQHKDLILALIDAFTGPVLEKFRIDAAEKFGALLRMCGPEYYTPPYLPPEYFREMVLPGATAAARILAEGGIFLRLHCHGRVRAALPMMIEMGARGSDPLEPPPDGDIALAEIKAKYGKDLVLFGNTELKALETAEPEEIDALVKRQMDAAKEGGGYIMLPTAAPINIPLSPRTERNYFAWIDAGLAYGTY